MFTCPHCRRPMGRGFLVTFTGLARLSEADQGALQTALGYAASPRLATRADWEKARPIRPPGGVTRLALLRTELRRRRCAQRAVQEKAS